KRAFGSLWVPQWGQVTANGLPQCRQNRLVAAFDVQQLAQTMVSPRSAPEPLAASVPESRLGAVVPRRGPGPRAAGPSAERRRLQVRRLGDVRRLEDRVQVAAGDEVADGQTEQARDADDVVRVAQVDR